MPLDDETIKRLLNQGRKARGSSNTTTEVANRPRPVQFGPLKIGDEMYLRCAQRGCGSPTCFKVNSIPYCMSHAITQLNRIILTEILDYDLTKCTCKAGGYSNGHTHTDDCELYTT